MDDYQILGLFLFLLALIIALFIMFLKIDDRSHRAVRSTRKTVQAFREHLINDHGIMLEPPAAEEQPTDTEELQELEEPDTEEEALQESDEALLGEGEDVGTEEDYSDTVEDLEEMETEDLDSDTVEDLDAIETDELDSDTAEDLDAEDIEDDDLQQLENLDNLEEDP